MGGIDGDGSWGLLLLGAREKKEKLWVELYVRQETCQRSSEVLNYEVYSIKSLSLTITISKL